MQPTQALVPPPESGLRGVHDALRQCTTLDAPMEFPGWTWTSRVSKVFNFKYSLPLLGAYHRYNARRNIFKTTRGRAWGTLVMGVLFGGIMLWGSSPAGYVFLGLALWQVVLLNWGKVVRSHLKLDAERYRLTRRFLSFETIVAEGGIGDITGLEIEQLDTEELQVAQADTFHDRTCLHIERRDGSKLCVAAGISTSDARWLAHRIDERLD